MLRSGARPGPHLADSQCLPCRGQRPEAAHPEPADPLHPLLLQHPVRPLCRGRRLCAGVPLLHEGGRPHGNLTRWVPLQCPASITGGWEGPSFRQGLGQQTSWDVAGWVHAQASVHCLKASHWSLHSAASASTTCRLAGLTGVCLNVAAPLHLNPGSSPAGLWLNIPDYDAPTQMVKPKERNTRYVDAVLTIPRVRQGGPSVLPPPVPLLSSGRAPRLHAALLRRSLTIQLSVRHQHDCVPHTSSAQTAPCNFDLACAGHPVSCTVACLNLRCLCGNVWHRPDDMWPPAGHPVPHVWHEPGL